LHSVTDSLHLIQSQNDIPVKRLVAKQGTRVEPITYWITVGDQVAVDGFKWKLAQIKYGLTGKIPDGLIFRISSIDSNPKNAYIVQDDFVNRLLAALSTDTRDRLVGKPRDKSGINGY
jgi:EpsI family protein